MKRDREWMYNQWDGKYLREEYINGVNNFIEFAKEQDDYRRCSVLRCPCRICRNKKYLNEDVVKELLFRKGFEKDYFLWVCHGEHFPDLVPPNKSSNPYRGMVTDALRLGFENGDVNMSNKVEEESKEVRYEVVDGRKKRKINGLGFGASSFCESESARSTQSSASSCDPSMMYNLETRLREQESETQKLKALVEERSQEIDKLRSLYEAEKKRCDAFRLVIEQQTRLLQRFVEVLHHCAPSQFTLSQQDREPLSGDAGDAHTA